MVGQIIEDSTPSFPNAINPGDGSKSRRGYHYVTRGFVLNEIMRRVDPKGRTIGQFIREELKGCEGKIYSDKSKTLTIFYLTCCWLLNQAAVLK